MAVKHGNIAHLLGDVKRPSIVYVPVHCPSYVGVKTRVPNGDHLSKWLTFYFVHVLYVRHFNKLINICFDMPARLSCENTQINLIWPKIWKYPPLSLC